MTRTVNLTPGLQRPATLGFWLLAVYALFLAVRTVTQQRTSRRTPPGYARYITSGEFLLSHLLLGMIGPLLLVLAAPVTLALRTLPVRGARVLVRLLDTWPVRFLVHPVTAATLNLGGLWLLYTTTLYSQTLSSPVAHGLVHVHVLLSGYLFAAAIVGIDPDRHRRSLLGRVVVLVSFMAGHSILAKFIYANPPVGVDAAQAELGAMVMYYGGDVVDLVLLVILGHRWYVRGTQRVSRAPSRRSPGALPLLWPTAGPQGRTPRPSRPAGRRVRRA